MSSPLEFDARKFWSLLETAPLFPAGWDNYDHQAEGTLLDPLLAGASFPVETGQCGHSDEGRVLRTLRLGTGKRRILVWARQHGDEPDCTAALMAVLHFLFQQPDSPESKLIRERLDILVMPMVNPDGVQRFTRRNAQGIDINRDAAAGATPEGRALLHLKDTFAPEVCLNLHDMNSRKTNEQGHPVAIAFQACPFAKEQNDNELRLRAKKICSIMADTAREFAGPNIARYTADYMPRAFGDNMMRWDVVSVLLEAGGHDPEQGGDDFVRTLFAVCLMRALVALANHEDINSGAGDYEAIPFDSGARLVDVVMQGGTVLNGIGRPPFRSDVAVNRVLRERPLPRTLEGVVEDLGDLSEGYAHRRIDVSCLCLMPGLIAIAPGFSFADDLPTAAEEAPFLRAGITTLACGFGPFASSLARAEWLASTSERPPSLNIIAFERVASLRELHDRAAMSELAGLLVQDLAITCRDLVGLLHLFHGASPESLEGVDAETIVGADLFLEGAPSPLQTRLHLHLSPIEGRSARTIVRRADLVRLADTFLREPAQITFSVDAADASLPWQPMLTATCGLSNGRAPSLDFLRRILEQNRVTDGSGLVAVSNLDALHTARLLRIGNFGRIEIGARADIAGFPVEALDTKRDGHRAGAALLMVNGELVIRDFVETGKHAEGRWHFASGVELR